MGKIFRKVHCSTWCTFSLAPLQVIPVFFIVFTLTVLVAHFEVDTVPHVKAAKSSEQQGGKAAWSAC